MPNRRSNAKEVKCNCPASEDTVFEVISGTYAELEALRASSSLVVANLYQMTDNTDADSGNILLSPASLDSFQAEITYIPSFDTSKRWFGIYDFARNSLIELRDDKQNIAIGSVAVNGMVWNDTNVYGNTFKNMATLDLSGNTGSIYQNTFTQESELVVVANTGTFEKNVADYYSYVELTSNAGYISGNNLRGGNLNITSLGNTGLIDSNTLDSGTITVNSSEADLRQNIIQSSQITITSTHADVGNNMLLKSVLNISSDSNNFFQDNTVNIATVALSGAGNRQILANVINWDSALVFASTTIVQNEFYTNLGRIDWTLAGLII